MTINRRAFIAISASALLLPPAYAQITDLNEAINKAGRMRMLSQRMTKAYLCLGQQVQAPAATKALEQSMALFDRQLVELKSYAPDAEVRDTFTQLESEWSIHKTLLVGTAPSIANAGKLLVQDNKLLELAHRGTVQLEHLSGKPLGKLVNLAGRQRMLSQRMAKYYLAMAWNLERTTAEKQIESARTEFVSALDTLRNAPEATVDIRRELILADSQWVFFDTALKAHAEAGGKAANNVFVTSENLLQVMDKVTELYTRAVKT